MPQPDGMITARVTINPPIDDAGVAQAGRYTFKSSRPRIWTATSTPVLPRPISVMVGPAAPGEIILPSTDQPGYSDGVGNSVIDFTYEVHISVQGQNPRTISLALPCGGVDGLEFDFDSSVPVPSSTGTLTPIPSAWASTTGLADAARQGAEVARDAAIAAENAAVAAADPVNLDPTVAALVPDVDTATGTAVAGLLVAKLGTADTDTAVATIVGNPASATRATLSATYAAVNADRLLGRTSFSPVSTDARATASASPVHIGTSVTGPRDLTVDFVAPVSGQVRFVASIYIAIYLAATNEYAGLAVMVNNVIDTASKRLMLRKGAATGQTTDSRVTYEYVIPNLIPGVSYSVELMGYSLAAGTISYESGGAYGATVLSAYEAAVASSNPLGVTATPVVAPTAIVSDTKYNSFAGVVKCPNGDLLGGYRKGDSHTVGGASAALCTIRSTDGGTTWGTPVVIANDPTYDYGTATLSVIDAGKIALVTWLRPNAGGRPILNGTRIYISSDNGLTWAAPVTVNTGTVLDRSSCSESALTYFNGAYYLGVWGEYAADSAGTYKSAIFQSADLNTWTAVATFGTVGVQLYNETGVAVVDGGLVGIVRDDTHVTIWTTNSTDGIAWSPLRQVRAGVGAPKFQVSTLSNRSYNPMRIGSLGYGYLAALSANGDMNRVAFLALDDVFIYGQAVWLGGTTIGVFWAAEFGASDARIYWATCTLA